MESHRLLLEMSPENVCEIYDNGKRLGEYLVLECDHPYLSKCYNVLGTFELLSNQCKITNIRLPRLNDVPVGYSCSVYYEELHVFDVEILATSKIKVLTEVKVKILMKNISNILDLNNQDAREGFLKARKDKKCRFVENLKVKNIRKED